MGLEQVASLLAANKGFWMFQVTVKSTFVWLGIAAAALRDAAAGH